MLKSAVHHATLRANALRDAIDQHIYRIMMAWVLLAAGLSAVRVAMSPLKAAPDFASILPYFLLVAAPTVSLMLALRWFARGEEMDQPTVRLARLGQWSGVTVAQARAHPLFGARGLMVSLLIGILMNIPFRALEYFGSMPALAGDIPPWLAVLRAMMTADLVLMTSLYAITFAAALRHSPIFPRMLIAVWLIDLMMQVLTAQMMVAEPGLPPQVGTALGTLLETNIKKLAISVALWLPYLLLSTRVNVTYRLRIPR
jgi:hypothetical protein